MDRIEAHLQQAINLSDLLYKELEDLSHESELTKTFYAPVFNTILEGGKFIKVNLNIVYFRYAQRRVSREKQK